MRVNRLALAAGLLLAATPVGAAQPWVGTCTAVRDGDTVEVTGDDGPVLVQIDGVDAPELDQAWGSAARDHLASLVLGQEVAVTPLDQRLEGAQVAQLTVNGVDVARSLLEAGMAWHDIANNSDEALILAMFTARSAGVGLWSDPDPVPPSRWRGLERAAAPPRPAPTPTARPRAGVGQGLVISDTNLAEMAARGHISGHESKVVVAGQEEDDAAGEPGEPVTEDEAAAAPAESEPAAAPETAEPPATGGEEPAEPAEGSGWVDEEGDEGDAPPADAEPTPTATPVPSST